MERNSLNGGAGRTCSGGWDSKAGEGITLGQMGPWNPEIRVGVV